MELRVTKDPDNENLTVSTYFLEIGEKIRRHIHTFEHSTECTLGESEVEIEGVKIFRMKPGDSSYMLPANIYHELRAVEDNTIIVNKSYFGGHNLGTISSRSLPKYVNRVMLEDGTIVEVKDEA